MNADDSLKLARRFIGLPLEKRQMFLAALHKEGVNFARFPIPQGVEAEDRQALSYAQQRMWFLWQLDPHSGAYNLPGAVRLTGRLNRSALEQAFASLVARHETLRTVFQRQADDSLLQVPASAPLLIEPLDFSALPVAAREQAVAEAAQQQSLLAFDLAVGPLLRVQLLKLADEEHVLLLTLHHIVSDGWSMNVLIDEFIRCYDAHDAGLEPQLAALPIQYSDYALWQRRWLEAGEQARQLQYWQATLGDEHPVLELPTDHSRPAMPSYRGTRYEFAVDATLAEQLRSTAQQHNVTLFMLLLSAFNVLLHRYTGQTDIRVGVPIANRNRGEIEGLIGFFVNTQVLRTQLDGETRVTDLLVAIKETALGAQAHQDLPFERLVEALKLERSLSHTPLFQVMYNHQPQVADISTVTTASGLELGAIEWEARTTQFDLTLDTYEKAGTLHAALTYANDLFDASTIARMAQHWTHLLWAIVADSSQRVGELPMLADAEQQVLVQDWNQTAASYPVDQCIHALIHAQVQRTPRAPALLFGDCQLTYAQLDARANQLAHCLREHGVGPDVLVGIAAERSLEMVIGLLAILKAGGAYVPLDPQYPAERLAYMVEDSAIGLLLTQRALLGSLPTDGVKVIVLDQDEHWLDAYSDECLPVATQPLNLAYVIYTSGSTGKPKGAGNTHAALVNRLCWMQQAYGLDDSDSVLQKTPFSFDVSVWEFFWPLMTGARLVVAPPGVHREPARLIELINDHGISTLHFVPSMLQAFIHEPGVTSCTSLKRIVCSGEALPLDAQLQVFGKLPDAGLFNLYGPTEAAIDVTHWTCVDEGADSVPIGRPIANLRTVVLDAQLLPVPTGVAGELYLGGTGLARSYHRRPGLTAERFVPCPFHDGARLYRTGDQVRQRADGVIEYLGRLDHQVKLRGLRIELGEIETRLVQHPLVREAVALVQGGKHLVAYAVLDSVEAQWAQTLKAWLLQSLPEYMVPTYLIALDALPVTANGKLDRKALPQPDAAPQQAFVAPQDALQTALAHIWQDVLGLERVGLDDNFFELGGDSIISIQVVSRARQAGIRLSPRDLFQYQSVRSLALVATFEHQSIIDQGPVTGEAILTPVQHSFFEQRIAQSQHWNQSLLLTPRAPLKPEALDAALVALLNHHHALRLRFRDNADGWQQQHAAPLERSGLWQRHAASTQALSSLCDEAQRSLDLSEGPLLRALLVSLDDGSQRLLLVIHHLVVDGVSWRILLEDLQHAYARLEAGSAVALPGKTSAYQTWAARLPEHARMLDAQLPYWHAQAADARDVPCENPQGSLQQRHARKIKYRLNAELTRQLLQQAPAAYRTQVNDLLLTALARVICRWTGHASALIQLEGHGREDLFDDVDLTRTVGWFTTLFPLRLQPLADPAESIKAIKEQVRAIPDKGLGYGLLRYLGEAAQREALQALPAPRITFNYLGQFDRQFDEQALFVPAGESAGQTQDAEAPLANWLTLESQVYGGQLSLQWGFSREMFADSTVQQLADAYAKELEALIEHCCVTPAGQATPSDFPLARLTQAQLDGLPVAVEQLDDLYPLSPMQQGLLFHTLYEQAAGEYVNQLRVDVQGLDPERFRAAWQATVDAQDILRTGFVWQGELEHAIQIVRKQVQLPFSVLDWRQRSDLAAALSDLANAEREQGFDLGQAPLLRLVLVQTAENAWHLVYTHHHILMDGWSNSQLLGEVLQRYSGHMPPVSAGRYRDYIGWLQRQDVQASEDFWGEQLAALQEPTRLAQGVAGQATGSGHGDHFQCFDQHQTQRLEAFARQQKITLNTLVQAAWLLLLQRYTHHETVAFGATVAGRPADLPGIEQQVGLFINTLPVIGTPRPDQSVAAWLQAVQAHNLGLRDFEHTPLADIQRWAGQSGEALFDNILVFENYPIAQALQQGSEQGVVFGDVANLEQTHYPLSVAVTLGETLAVHYSFDPALFAPSAIEQISVHLGHFLLQFSESAERCLGEIALTSAAELARQTAANQPQRYPVNVAVHQRIAELAAQRPHNTAVIFAGERFSYGSIDQRANQLAHVLIARGVGPETRVGVALPRSEGVIVALLAVLKAGGAYVPLDTSYPRERLAYLIEDSGLALLLTDSSVAAQLPVPASVSLLQLDQLNLDDQPLSAPSVRLDPHNLAYVIYTSGSTGNPKGVSVAHGPLAMHCQAIGERYEMRDSDCEFHFMSFAFDGAHERWLTSLTHGASLLIRDDSLWTPEQTYNAMREHAVTVVAFPPVYLQQLAEHAERGGHPPKVRIYCFGGDAVPAASFERVKRALDPDYIINGYGPTETVVTPLIWKAGRDVSCGAAYAPIGSRIGDRSAYVLDADLNLLPQGMAGELYLGGTGLARGYLNRPGLTAERFVADPFSATGGLLYRSGDWVRQRADGTFDYLDRIDNQVKIRGFRIELGEIEARLQALAGVREAVVVAQEGSAGTGKRLVAYVVADALNASCTEFADSLREQLKAALPAHMVPAYLLMLERLPLTPNGKLDRKNLPKPDVSQLQQHYVAPHSELEQQLAAIWQDVLKLEQVGLSDNFFELGGDSIISIQVVSRARQLGIRFTPKDLFQHQTLQTLALVARVGEPSQQIDQRPVTGELTLLPVQQVFFDQAIPERQHWNQAVMLTPARTLDADLLEQALGALVAHHDGLRLSFAEGASGWQGHYRPLNGGAQALVWSVDAADAAALQPVANAAQRSLHLHDGPLVRAVLAHLADGSQRLLLVIHHLVVDGVSWRILFEDLQSAYAQLAAGEPLQLPAKTTAAKVWAEQLQAYARSAPLQAELADWQQRLQDADATLPLDNPAGGLKHKHAVTVRTRLDRELTRQLLQDAPAAYRTQVNDLLLTALARVIVRWTGAGSALIQLEGHGREELFDNVDLTRTVGWFTSLYPARLTPTADLGGSLKHVKEQLRAIPNKGIGFGALAHFGDDSTRAALGQLPVPRLTFNYLGQFDGSFTDSEGALFVPSGEAAGDELNAEAPLANVLALNGQVFAGELDLGWTFSREMFHEATIQRLADDYAQELQALIGHCCEAGQHGITPSDFPLARLSQAQLDDLPLPAYMIEDVYPLSPMQQGMLFHALYEEASGDYINQLRLDVEGLDPERFHKAWQAAVSAHDILRTRFVWQGAVQAPVQVVSKTAPMPYRLHDLRTHAQPELALQSLADSEREQLNLSDASLLRLVIVRLDEQRYHLIYTNHHILMDGWSNSQLLGEVLQRYSGQFVALNNGRYRDYIAWLQRQDAAASEAFWTPALRELEEPTRLAQTVTPPPVGAAGYGDHFQVLDAGLTARLGEFARSAKVTVNTLVQAAWLLLLQRYSGKDTVAFGATVAGRPADLPGVEQQIGLFINTLPVIASPRAEQSLGSWLQAVQTLNVALREFEHTPLFDIQRWARQGGEALFDTLMVFENYPISQALEQGAAQGLRFSAADTREQTHYPLTLLVGLERELILHLSYQRSHFAQATAAQLATHLQHLLSQMLAGEQQCLADLVLLEPAEHQRIVRDWNRSDEPFADDLCVHELIARQVAATPDARAVTFGTQHLSYAELDAQANRLAHRLIEAGVGPEVRVGVAMPRSEQLLVALLAVLKAGGAYVPLDPQYPAERVAYMLEDSHAVLLLTEHAVAAQLQVPSATQVLLLDDAALSAAYPDHAPATRVTPDHLAYVIYTSGSTGQPKGVAIAHRNVLALIDWSQSVYSREDIQGVLASTSVCFDLSVWELFVTLANGGSLIIARNALELPQLPARDQVRLINTVPSAINALHGAGQIPPSVRIINLAGEPLTPTLVDALYQQPTVERVFDLYGPSEDTTYSTWTRRTAGGSANIGRPLKHTASYLLDADLQAVPQGVSAELYLAGAGITRGYLNRPAMTAERYVPNPFASHGERLYRTGDLARYRADGVLEYRGRLDHQVKIRGFRIELSEIEARLLQVPMVSEAAVLAQDALGAQQLVAYVVAPSLALDDGQAQRRLREQLKARLKESLPEYMVPAHLLFLAQLPLTPNGKLDRKALPAVDANQMQAGYVAPVGELEQQVAAIWAQVLMVERVGLNDHFFELGGHSLLAVNVVSRIALELGQTLTPQLLFQNPVLSDFVARLEIPDGAINEQKLNKLESLLDEMEEV